jgi:hypothetical protein
MLELVGFLYISGVIVFPFSDQIQEWCLVVMFYVAQSMSTKDASQITKMVSTCLL